MSTDKRKREKYRRRVARKHAQGHYKWRSSSAEHFKSSYSDRRVALHDSSDTSCCRRAPQSTPIPEAGAWATPRSSSRIIESDYPRSCSNSGIFSGRVPHMYAWCRDSGVQASRPKATGCTTSTPGLSSRPTDSKPNPAINISLSYQKALDCLGINTSHPTVEELRHAYRETARRWHPDRPQNHNNTKDATERFQEASAAFELLKHELKYVST